MTAHFPVESPHRYPIQVEFTVIGRSAVDLEQKAFEQMGAFAGARKWYIRDFYTKPYIKYTGEVLVVSWQAEIVGKVASDE